jgi:hypothetical protein
VLGAIESGLQVGEPRTDQAQMCKDFLLVEATSYDLERRHGAAWVYRPEATFVHVHGPSPGPAGGYGLLRCNVPLSGYGEEGPKGGL